MFISYSHEFILVHVPKTAGTSIRSALQPYAYDAKSMLINRIKRRLGIKWNWPCYRWNEVSYHATPCEMQETLPPRIFERFFKFAFVRNPWDWLVSHYHYTIKRPDHPLYDDVIALSGFSEYVSYYIESRQPRQIDSLLNRDGDIGVNFVGRFESIREDFSRICEQIGIQIDLPHENRSQHDPYHTYYSEEDQKKFVQYFERDIETFDYSFD